MLNQYDNGRRSIWDVIGERRMEAQRLAEASKPKGDYNTEHVAIERAWAWLPSMKLEDSQPIESIAACAADTEHDPRLSQISRARCNVHRIVLEPPQAPQIQPLDRALQLLHATFTQWQDFVAEIDWPHTQVFLFLPSAVSSGAWRNPVQNALFARYPLSDAPMVVSGTFADWLPGILASRSGSQYLLCLSIDSHAVEGLATTAAAGCVAGESICALLLRRVANEVAHNCATQPSLFPAKQINHVARKQQPRKHTTDVEELVVSLSTQAGIAVESIQSVITEGGVSNNRLSQLSSFLHANISDAELNGQVVASPKLTGQVGQAATQITHLAIAFLAAKAKPGAAVLVLDRHSETTTQGWLIVHPIASDTADIAVG